MNIKVTEKGCEGPIHFYRNSDGQLELATDEAQPVIISADRSGLADDLVPEKEYEVSIKVVNFVYGTGGNPNRLYAEFVDSPSPSLSDIDSRTDRQSKRKQRDSNIDQDDSRTLSELTGDGSRIDLQVWVDSVSGHRSPEVLQTGNLADDSVSHTPPFVTFEDGNVQRLEARKFYTLQNVKDNYYERKDRIQVVIDKHSNITSHDAPGDPPESMIDSKFDDDTYDSLSDAAVDHMDAGLRSSEAPEDFLDRKHRNQ